MTEFIPLSVARAAAGWREQSLVLTGLRGELGDADRGGFPMSVRAPVDEFLLAWSVWLSTTAGCAEGIAERLRETVLAFVLTDNSIAAGHETILVDLLGEVRWSA